MCSSIHNKKISERIAVQFGWRLADPKHTVLDSGTDPLAATEEVGELGHLLARQLSADTAKYRNSARIQMRPSENYFCISSVNTVLQMSLVAFAGGTSVRTTREPASRLRPRNRARSQSMRTPTGSIRSNLAGTINPWSSR